MGEDTHGIKFVVCAPWPEAHWVAVSKAWQGKLEQIQAAKSSKLCYAAHVQKTKAVISK